MDHPRAALFYRRACVGGRPKDTTMRIDYRTENLRGCAWRLSLKGLDSVVYTGRGLPFAWITMEVTTYGFQQWPKYVLVCAGSPTGSSGVRPRQPPCLTAGLQSRSKLAPQHTQGMRALVQTRGASSTLASERQSIAETMSLSWGAAGRTQTSRWLGAARP